MNYRSKGKEDKREYGRESTYEDGSRVIVDEIFLVLLRGAVI